MLLNQDHNTLGKLSQHQGQERSNQQFVLQERDGKPPIWRSS